MDNSLELLPEPPLPQHHSEHQKKHTEFYVYQCNMTDIKEPKSVSNTQANQNWADAMRNEINSLDENYG